jgi:hypothetical protein
METTIIKNRKARYIELTHAEPQPPRVYTADRSRCGYVIGMASPYTGEAGYSQRVRVLWANGRTTLCCLRGMVPAFEDSRVLAGFREWTIR